MDNNGYEDDEAQRVKFKNKNYNLKVPFTNFVLGLSFQDLQMFKMALTQFSTRERFDFKYKKNDKVRVRAICSANGCNWSILCSWCSATNTFMVKTYMNEHSCLPASKNKRVTASVIARKYWEEITSMPFIKPRHLRALVRKDLGVMVSQTVCRAAKGEVIKQMEEKYKEEFKVLNDYAEELKTTNPKSTVIVISKNATLDLEAIFDRLYIFFGALKRVF